MTPTELDWFNYEAANRRANREYRNFPSITDAILDDLESHGSVGRTSRRLAIHLGLLVELVPEWIDRRPLRLLPEVAS